MYKAVILLCLGILLAQTEAGAQIIHYVDLDATGANNGASWNDAFISLQDALAIAVSGDQIWVAEGAYLTTFGTDRSISFELVSGVQLFGGFSGTETQLEQRDWTQNATVLSGDIGELGPGDNSFHVVVASGTDPSTLLDGFSIEWGNANGNTKPLGAAGGGIYMQGGSPTIQNVILRFNYAPSAAGIMVRDLSEPTITNALIIQNLSEGPGGGISVITESSAVITNSTFSANIATIGGGVYASTSTVEINNSILWENIGNEIEAVSGADINVNHAVVEGGYDGIAVLDHDPDFIDSGEGDYRIELTSIGVDAGNGSLLISDSFDIDQDGDTNESFPYDLGSNPREQLGSVDLGAYEAQKPECPTGTTLFVDIDASGTGSGATWEDGYNNLGVALSLARSCGFTGSIWVAEGVYKPSEAEIQSTLFSLAPGVKLFGGFKGTEEEVEQRDWELHPTILSGEYGGPNTWDNAYHIVAASNLDSQSVLDGFYIQDAARGAVLITSGSPVFRNLRLNNNRVNTDNRGAAIYCDNCSLELQNAHFDSNVAFGSNSGVLYSIEGNVQLIDASFRDNTGNYNYHEGCIYIESGSVSIDNVLFENNFIGGSGSGAIYLEAGDLEVNNAEFTESIPAGIVQYHGTSRIDSTLFQQNGTGLNILSGTSRVTASTFFSNNNGGIQSAADSLLIRNSSFSENRASTGPGVGQRGGVLEIVQSQFRNNIAGREGLGYAAGGAIHVRTNANVQLVNLVIDGNQSLASIAHVAATARGGAIYIEESSMSIVNSKITNNYIAAGGDIGTTERGGGIFISSGQLQIINTTISDNQSNWSSGGNAIYAEEKEQETVIDVHNSIIWENEGEPDIRFLDEPDIMVAYSVVEGGFEGGVEIIDQDPLLSKDYYLQEFSPAIDFGNLDYLPADIFDLDNDGDLSEPLPIDLNEDPRVLGNTIDLGAYESPYTVDIQQNQELPSSFSLHGAYPNPFNPTTSIAFDLPRDAEVVLEVFDVLGRRVLQTTPETISAGANRTIQLTGSSLTSGLYLYRVTATMGDDTIRAGGRVTLLK